MTTATLPTVESNTPWTPKVVGRDPTPFGGVPAGPAATGTPDLLNVDPIRGIAEPDASWARGLSFDQARAVIVHELGEGPIVGVNGQTLDLKPLGSVRSPSDLARDLGGNNVLMWALLALGLFALAQQ